MLVCTDGGDFISNDSPIEQVRFTVPITDDVSPIEQVRLTVPITDDPTVPALTFRTWVLGPFTCAIPAFVSQFSVYRQNIFSIPDADCHPRKINGGNTSVYTIESPRNKLEFLNESGAF
ncbi:hypothetical protein Dsin_025142 [Dipteronia sinensis]|uniref:Uncharacterized protein n=1 Tax=Dipteronia sinensis TaxID=43782 RepID=A0AAE0DWN9_9ROSI|nr:hypothetical protein Dsin_025142 [Dipteronia sinensis]